MRFVVLCFSVALPFQAAAQVFLDNDLSTKSGCLSVLSGQIRYARISEASVSNWERTLEGASETSRPTLQAIIAAVGEIAAQEQIIVDELLSYCGKLD